MFGYLLPAQIGGVVSNAEMEVRFEADHLPVILNFELHPHSLVLEDDGKLLAQYVQDLVVESVEFVEANPQP